MSTRSAADLQREHDTQATAQHAKLGAAQLTISAQQNPMYLSDLTDKAHPTIDEGSETLSSIDRHVDHQEVTPMLAAAKAKHADGVRTELDLNRLPSAGVMKDFEAWKGTLQKTKDGSLAGDSLSAFHAYETKHDAKADPAGGGRQGMDRQLIYLQAMDEQMKQMREHHLKSDITLGLGNINKALRGHTLPDGHVNTQDPAVREYLTGLGAKAAFVGQEAGASGAARIELGNEANNAKNMGRGADGNLVDAHTNADRYGLVEGSLYRSIKGSGDLHGMHVDMGAMMQESNVNDTRAFLTDMHASQQHYFGGDQQALMTDETNMHLYATRDIAKNGQEHFDMHKAEQTEQMYAELMASGMLPRNTDVSELGVYEGRLWDASANHYVAASDDTNAVQAGDNFSMVNELVDQSEGRFHIQGLNLYGYGGSGGYGPDRDTAVTSTGHNTDLTFAGIGGR